jgi:xanthine dehydrogenase accessory factor
MKNKPILILIRGGGDLASGVALRLHRAGFGVLISELPQPLAVRRTVSFAEAVYEGQVRVEDVTAKLVEQTASSRNNQAGNWKQLWDALDADEIPVIVDPNASILTELSIPIVIDARLIKLPPDPLPVEVALHIGLGPGFRAGSNCHAVIETRRSHTLGRVYWNGTTQPDSGQPEGDRRRVLRAPKDGTFVSRVKIGQHVEAGQVLAKIADEPITAPFSGVVRGLIRSGLHMTTGLKIGDVDPRDDPTLCDLVSDKALAIGGGVLEAILTKPEIRAQVFANPLKPMKNPQ